MIDVVHIESFKDEERDAPTPGSAFTWRISLVDLETADCA